jgi:steroid delta-isomerase-like uncharacterized protein
MRGSHERSMKMETKEMKDLVVRFVEEFWNKGNLQAADDLMTSDAVVLPEVGGIEGLKAFAAAFRSAFPDWHSTAEEIIAEGDTVAERWTAHGTHQGEFFGAAATGNRVALPGVVIYRIRDGKIVQFRGYYDRYTLFQQVGLLPAEPGVSQ